MRNSTKMGGSVKKKYQTGGSTGYMKPTKKIMTKTGPDSYDKAIAKNKAAMEAIIKKEGVRKAVEKAKTPMPKKQMGGMIPTKPIATAPIQGTTGRRGAAGSNMANGGSLKPVNPGANPGLAKLPTPVRNKMGYMKKGGTKKYATGGPGKGATGAAKGATKSASQKNAEADRINSMFAKPPGGAPFKSNAKPTGIEGIKSDMRKIGSMSASKAKGSSSAKGLADGKMSKNPLDYTAREIGNGVYNTGKAVAGDIYDTAKRKAGYVGDAFDAGYNIMFKKKGGQAHPGFKAVQSKIAAKSGVSKKAAGAILAASTRKASAKAKAANPKLKRVKG